MKRQEAQSNSVAAKRGWKQLRARAPVGNASKSDSAGQCGESADERRSQTSFEDELRSSQSMAMGCCRTLSGGWEPNGTQSEVRVTRESRVQPDAEFMIRPAGSEEPRHVAVRASIVAQASRPWANSAWLARRRVTTAGAKGRRKVDTI